MYPAEGTGVVCQEVQDPAARRGGAAGEEPDGKPCVNEHGEKLQHVDVEDPSRKLFEALRFVKEDRNASGRKVRGR